MTRSGTGAYCRERCCAAGGGHLVYGHQSLERVAPSETAETDERDDESSYRVRPRGWTRVPSRRDLLKGGALAAAFAPLASLRSGAADAALEPMDLVSARGSSRWRGSGPLYWTSYGYENQYNTIIPESEWTANVEWVDANFKDHGYTMVCTDGWIDSTQEVTKNGYIVKHDDSWSHDWAWWAQHLARKGMQLGIYYNPLWVTRSAVDNRSVTVAGRPDVRVADIVNADDPFDGTRQIYWVDATREGAHEYVSGYVRYFRELGAAMLRVDFLGWYEIGYDQSEGTVCMAHGRQAYTNALEWMHEAAGDMTLSLVMPNLFDHGSAERIYGDMIRIDNDVAQGGWFSLSEGRQTWQPIWSQWNNPFLGFSGFSDLSGRGQVVLDGDPTIISSFSTDDQRRSAINLMIMAGAPIAIADRQDTIGTNSAFFQNAEVLALRQAGLVGKPVYANGHLLDFDPTSRDPERWVGQLPDSSWVVGLFNRSGGAPPITKSMDFARELGLEGEATVRDLWAHRDLGRMTSWTVSLGPYASSLVKVTPQARAHYQAEVGSWSGGARFDNTFSGHEGFGYVTGLDEPGASVSVCVSVPTAGSYRIACRVANASGSRSTLTATAADPSGGRVHSTSDMYVPSTTAWNSWQIARVTLRLDAGDNIVTLLHGPGDEGGVNVDSLALVF
jgi:glucan 1,6-alpha-isomaltosidase